MVKIAAVNNWVRQAANNLPRRLVEPIIIPEVLLLLGLRVLHLTEVFLLSD
jgi:hypothetical protein